MIKVDSDLDVESYDSHGNRYVKVNLIADSSIEVEDIGTDGSSVVGLSAHDKLVMGCTCFTTTMEFGMLDSTGNWRFQ